ncbi:MAG: chloramphenicol resistance protein [Lachnospiraceae bacterium]|nr:chloramphenicol resistance protein [Lachnospiraceae bacterium]
MSVIGEIRSFIYKECPCLDEFNERIKRVVGIEHLNEERKSYMVEASVTDKPIMKRYLDGSSERQFNFIFASREYFGSDIAEALDVAEFYEDFSEWLEECTETNNVPVLGEGKEVKKMVATTNGYVFNADETAAQYQIQCKIIYNQKAR